MEYYEYVNGHTILTEKSIELENEALKDYISVNKTCKNCGKSGSRLYEEECDFKELQRLDKLLEKTYNRLDHAESFIKIHKRASR